MAYKNNLPEISNFIIAGILANIASFSVFYFAYYQLEIGGFWGSMISQGAGVTLSYFYNTRKTFKKRSSLIRIFGYYTYYGSAIICVAKAIDALIVINANPMLSWLICVLIATVINYIVIKTVIFRE